jgi:two-component system, chemotaxis family, chemotaxis protein CheY
LKSCLIVDDSPVIRKVAKRIIHDLQYAIVEADSGADGLSKFRSGRHDVILLDHILPDMTAIEFIEATKRLAPDFKPTILLCITQLDVVRIMKAKRAGASGYVLKPFTRATLFNSFTSQIADLAA